MPGPTFAQGEVDLTLDGRGIPLEAAAAAALGAKAFSAAWNSQMAATGRTIAGIFRKNGLLAGINFGSGFRTAFGKIASDVGKILSRVANSNFGVNIWMGFTRAREAISSAARGLGEWVTETARVNPQLEFLRARLQTLTTQAQIFGRRASTSIRSFGDTIKNSYIGQRLGEIAVPFQQAMRRISASVGMGGPVFARLGEAARSVGSIFQKNTKAIEKQGSAWKGLSANTRQWILIIGAVAAGMGQLAPLASAAAAGLTVLGGAAAALVLGLGVGIAAFQGLTGDIAALPAAVQPAAAAFQSIGDAFDQMQDRIQIAALSGAAPAFESLRATVEGLIPAFESVGAIVGQVIGMFAASIAPGTAGFANLQAIIVGLGQSLVPLTSAFLVFGEAFGNVFVIALPFVQRFAEYLAVLAGQFLAFTQSNGDVISQWFENGFTILSAFGDLLGAVGTALADLVTPSTVASVVGLLDSLTGFVPALTGILAVLGELDIFGLLAAALDALGPAIMILVPPLMEIANVVSSVLLTAFAALGPVIAQVATALAPVISVIGELISAVLPPLLALLMPIITALATFATTIIAALMPAVSALLPAVTAILTALSPLATLIASLIAQLGPILVPVITLLVGVFTQLITAIAPIIEAILPPLISLISALMPIVILLVDAFVQLLTPILSLLDPLLQLIGEIIPPLAELITGILVVAVNLLKGAFEFLIPIITGVVTAIVGVLRPAIESITTVLGGLIDFIIGVFTGDWERAWGGIADIFSGIWEGLAGIAEGAINGIIDIVNGAIAGINSVGGAVGINIGKIPKVYFAAGGILNGRTDLGFGRVGGEAGPEAIVPLNRPLGAVDPSVRYLSAVAQGLALPGGGPSRIVTVEEGAFTFIVPSEQAGRVIANSVLDNLVAASAM